MIAIQKLLSTILVLARAACRSLLATALALIASGAFAAPDLAISGLTVGTPGTTQYGQYVFSVSYTVTNVGDATAAGAWSDRIYVSNDGAVDASDWIYSVNQSNMSVAPGSSYTVTRTVTTDVRPPGPHTIFARANGDGRLVEPEQTNNTTPGIGVTFARADLAVSGLTVGAPTTTQYGQYVFSMSYTVTNVGQGTAVAAAGDHWADRLFVSADGTPDAGDWAYGTSKSNYSLAPGASYVVSATVTTSPMAPGTYTVFASTNYGGRMAEDNWSNNTTAGVSITFKRPDLAISGLTVGAPSTTQYGQYVFSLSYTVTNVGQGTAVAASGDHWADRVFVSADGTPDAGDWAYTSTKSNYSLAPGASYVVSATVTTSPMAPGTYTVFARTNYGGRMVEDNWSNNTTTQGISITFKRPDLAVSGLTLGTPSTTQYGQYVFPMSYTVTNVGEGTAVTGSGDYWSDKLYVSTDGTPSAGDWGVISNRWNTSLAPGASYVVSATLTTSPMAPGTYTVFAKANDGGRLAEDNWSNNTTAGVSITFKRPDLAISGLTVGAPTTTQSGQYVFPMSYTVTNVGEGTAVAASGDHWADRVFVSADGTPDAGDWAYTSTKSNYSLAPGASYVVSATLTTTSMAAGTYTVFASANYGGRLAEDNWSNNTTTPGVSITFRRPDLTISGASVGAVTDNPDGSFSMPVSFTVTNVGEVDALPSWTDRAYLSTNATLDGTDKYGDLNTRGTALPPGASYTVSATFKTATTTAPGAYTLFLVANGSGGVAELGSANNTAAFSVTLPARTATTTTLTSSATTLAAGDALTLTASVVPATATGAVTFMDGTTTLGTASLQSGTASLATSLKVAGVRSVTAVYGGDVSLRPSTSTAVSHTVSKGATTTTLQVSTSSVAPNETITLAVSVSGAAPTGLVTFKDGTNTIGSRTLFNGSATLTETLTVTGTHNLTVSYAGDGNNLASTSAAKVVEVSSGAAPGAAMRWTYGYDAVDRPNSVVDPSGQATYFYYDALGRRIQTQQPPNTGSSTPTVTQFAYDGADQVTSVTDPRNLTTTYTVTGTGDLLSTASPDSGTAGSTYDASGNLLTQTDARGKTTTYAYDSLNRVTSISYASGVPTTFEYDGGVTQVPASIGKLTRMTDESGSTSYTHDAYGRIASKVQVVGGTTFTVGYTWGDSGSALDKLTAITYPSGSRVNYSYDQLGRVSGVTVNPVNANGQGISAASVTLLSGISYNAENNRTGWLWSDGKARTIGYDGNGLVSSYNLGDPLGTGGAAGLQRSIQRDAAGRITGYTHSNNGNAQASFNQSFGYDNLDRLTTATQASSTTQYSYDATGNRTAKTVGGTTYANTVSSTSNRVTQVQDPFGVASVSYDAAGNTVGDGTYAFAYSDRGRMASATSGSGTVNYLYDGYGLRVKKSGPTALVATGASHFVYDEAGQLLGEYDANGTPVYETIYLGSTPVGATKQTGSTVNSDVAVTLYNVYSDHIDTPRAITKQDQTIVWRWDAAEAFGATAPDQNPNGLGAFAYNQRFPGQVFDAETGLFQNWNREYNARTGRYIQSDPIGLAGGINTFAYVEGNPLSLVDPEGLAPTKAVIWLVKICKTGIQRIRPVSPEEAVRLAKQGKDLESNRSTVKKIANAASEGKKPIKNKAHPDPVTGSTEGRKPHYHPNPRTGSHIFYSAATAMTLAGQVDCDDCTLGYVAEALDFFNPLSLPKDLMDLTGIGAPN